MRISHVKIENYRAHRSTEINFNELTVLIGPVSYTHLDVYKRQGQVIDYYTLERRLNEYKQQLIAGRDLDKVRIKLIIPAKNLGL